jgi:CHAD domain-containing protein
MKHAIERELKLEVGPRFRLPKLPGEPLAPRIFASVYYDTPDHRLARQGVTVRCRTEKRAHHWQVKLPRGAARLELEVGAPPSALPAELGRLLTLYTRGADLVPVATLLTRRSGIRVRDLRGPVAEVVLDSVSVFENRRVMKRFREVEVELVGGDEAALEHLGALLRAAGATDGDGRPKLLRALGLNLAAETKSPAPSDTALDHVLAMLRAQLESVRARDPGTRLGREPEELHQMRAAVRRLRAILRAARPLFQAEASEALREELAWLNSALGGRRDLDVLREYLATELAALDPLERRGGQRLLRRLDDEREGAGAALLEVLDSPRYFALLDRLEAFAAHPPASGEDVSLRELAGAEFRKLRKAARALAEAPSDAELHAVRIKAKRARHAAELAAPVVGRRAERFAEMAKRLQDILGEHQDAVVAEARLRQLFDHAPGRRAGFVAGRLVERQRARREAARAAYTGLWPKVERRGRKAWE